jgi:ribosomal protein S18 acetylase RimI-like enzyme
MTARPTPPITIRRAKTEDIEALTAIYVDSARHHTAVDPEVHQIPNQASARDRIRAKLVDEATSVFAAVVDDEVIGLLQIDKVPPPTSGAMVRAFPSVGVGIAVREGGRSQGVGTELMRFAESIALEGGATTIILDMSAANAGALRFYERLGYRTYGFLLRKTLAKEAAIDDAEIG